MGSGKSARPVVLSFAWFVFWQQNPFCKLLCPGNPVWRTDSTEWLRLRGWGSLASGEPLSPLRSEATLGELLSCHLLIPHNHGPVGLRGLSSGAAGPSGCLGLLPPALSSGAGWAPAVCSLPTPGSQQPPCGPLWLPSTGFRWPSRPEHF